MPRSIVQHTLNGSTDTLHLPKDWEILDAVDVPSSAEDILLYLAYDTQDSDRQPVTFHYSSFACEDPQIHDDWCFLRPIKLKGYVKGERIFLFCVDGWTELLDQQWLSNHGLDPAAAPTSLTPEEHTAAEGGDESPASMPF